MPALVYSDNDRKHCHNERAYLLLENLLSDSELSKFLIVLLNSATALYYHLQTVQHRLYLEIVHVVLDL